MSEIWNDNKIEPKLTPLSEEEYVVARQRIQTSQEQISGLTFSGNEGNFCLLTYGFLTQTSVIIAADPCSSAILSINRKRDEREKI